MDESASIIDLVIITIKLYVSLLQYPCSFLFAFWGIRLFTAPYSEEEGYYSDIS